MKTILSLFLGAAIFLCSHSHADDKMKVRKIVHLDPSQLETVDVSPVQDYPFMKVIDGDKPLAGGLTSYESADGQFEVGLSRYSQITLRLRDWPVDEFMYFLEGQVEITDEDGSSRVYGPGDAIVMPKGFNGTWRQLSPIRKINVSYPVGE